MPFTVKTTTDIPGWTTPLQHIEYKKLANELPANPRILEIGCGWGRSTWAWLDALPVTATYCVVDNFKISPKDCYKSQYNYFLKRNPKVARAIRKWYNHNVGQYDIFSSIISKHPNSKIIKNVWNIDSDDWIQSKNFSVNWDLVYLDDRHEFRVMQQWLDLFSRVPIVCGDDYTLKFPEIIRAVDEYSKKQNAYKKIVQASGFFIIKNNLTI